jgi:hypothetical protein
MLDRANKIAVLFESVHGQKLPELIGKGHSIRQSDEASAGSVRSLGRKC